MSVVVCAMHVCLKDPTLTKRHISALTQLAVMRGRMVLMKLLLASVVTGLTGNFEDSLRVYTSTFLILGSFRKETCL